MVHRLHQPACGAGTAHRGLVLRAPRQGKDRRTVRMPRTGELGATHHGSVPPTGIDDDGNATTRASRFFESPEPLGGRACSGNLHVMSQVHAPPMHDHRGWHDGMADPRHARCCSMVITRRVVAVRSMVGKRSAATARRRHHVEERLHGRLVNGATEHPFVHAVQRQQPRRRQGGSVVLPGILQKGEAFEEFGSEHGGPSC